MPSTPLPTYVPGERPFSFRRLLQPIPGAGPRQFRPVRAGAYIVSIQASAAHASSPAGEPPPEDVESFEVAIFTSGADSSPPQTVFPRSHPHLFRDKRWSRSWVPRYDGAESTFWSGHFIATHVVADLLTCLVDPAGYTLMLTQGMIPQPPD